MSGIFDQIINYSPPLIVSGTVNYKGTWDASTNTPTLNNPPAASTKGDYYVVSVAGTQFSISFAVGDWIISSGTAWEKVDLTDAVSSVFGRTGAVVGVSTDYSSVGLTNTAIGASSPSTGAFTTLGSSSTTTLNGTTIPASSTLLVSGGALGTPSSGTLTSCTGLPISTGVSGLGTGIATALAINTGSAGAPVLFNGALGTPTSGTATNLTGTSGITGTGVLNSGSITSGFGSIDVGADSISGGAGAFTTLSATGASTIQNTLTITRSSSTARTLTLSLENGTADYITDAAGAYPHRFFVGATKYAQIDTTGLAVTGALSSTTGATFATSSGSVGIGTASPAAMLHVTGSSRFDSDSSFNLRIFVRNPAGQDWALRTNTSSNNFEIVDWGSTLTRVSITTAGNVGIGVTPSAWSGPALQIGGVGVASRSGLNSLAQFSANQYWNGASHRYINSDYATLYTQNAGAHNWSIAASGTAGAAISFTTAMTLDASGNLLVGTTSGSGNRVDIVGSNGCKISGWGAGVGTGLTMATTTTTSSDSVSFEVNGTQVGKIQTTSSGTSYVTSSDYRRKSNVQDLTGSGTFIDALKPRTFDWDTGDKGVGFIAHEFAEVSPSSVCGEKDAVDSDGKPKYQAMQASSAEVIANLVAELQSVRQRLAALETK